MSFWQSQRVPEPEQMDSGDEVEAYCSAAAGKHLDAIDDTFIEHLLRLLPPSFHQDSDPVWALDIGTGPAQIPIKALQKLPHLRFVGLDRFPNMLAAARRSAVAAGVSGRLALLQADGQQLPFPNGAFPIVTCNSVLHHAARPAELLKEVFRVASPEAAILVRDLRRPSRLGIGWHLWRHGRRYQGEMRRLFHASVRAAYTLEELRQLLAAAGGQAASVFRYRGAHLGIERAAGGRNRRGQAPLG